MTKGRAEQIIVISLFVFMASEIGNHLLTKGKDKEHKRELGKRVVGGFLTFLFSSFAAEVAPQVGALLALAVASFAFFNDGLPAINRGYGQSKKQTEKLSKQEFEREKFPATPGPTPSPLPLGETSPVSVGIETAGLLI